MCAFAYVCMMYLYAYAYVYVCGCLCMHVCVGESMYECVSVAMRNEIVLVIGYSGHMPTIYRVTGESADSADRPFKS